MVELSLSPLDAVFGSLAHPVRREILRHVAKKQELSVSDIAKPYAMTLAAVSKHLKILEKARLIVKRRRGKEQIVRLSPVAFKDAADYLRFYEKMWNDRLDSLEQYLATFPKDQ